MEIFRIKDGHHPDADKLIIDFKDPELIHADFLVNDEDLR